MGTLRARHVLYKTRIEWMKASLLIRPLKSHPRMDNVCKNIFAQIEHKGIKATIISPGQLCDSYSCHEKQHGYLILINYMSTRTSTQAIQHKNSRKTKETKQILDSYLLDRPSNKQHSSSKISKVVNDKCFAAVVQLDVQYPMCRILENFGVARVPGVHAEVNIMSISALSIILHNILEQNNILLVEAPLLDKLFNDENNPNPDIDLRSHVFHSCFEQW